MKRSPLLPIFLIVLVDILGLTIILPLLPFYAEHLGASATVVGLLISTYAFFQLIAGPILGRWSDRIGRKPVLMISQLGTFVGFLILAGSNTLWLVFLSRIIDGATAGNLVVAQAYIADVTEPENRARSFGIIGIAFGVGFLIGPAVSGFLSQYGYAYPILLAALLSATSVVCTMTLLPTTPPHPEEDPGPGGRRLSIFQWKAYADYFKRPELAPLLWQFFFFAFGFALFISGFALFAQRRYTWNGHPAGAREVGYVLGYVGFLGIVLQGGLMGRLVKSLGERTLVWTGFAVTSATSVWLSFTYTLPQVMASSTLGSYGNGVVRPALTSLITRRAGKREQGAVLGLTQSLYSVSQIVAPIIAGTLIDRGYLSTWALLGAVVAFCGFIAALRYKNAGTS